MVHPLLQLAEGLAGEYDAGRNAFQASNLWSGSGPADAFGFPTGKAISFWNLFAGNTCGNGTTTIVKGKLIQPCYPLLNTYGRKRPRSGDPEQWPGG